MHIPVLLKQVVEYLNPGPGKNFIDATVGGGGHSFEILKRTEPGGRVLGIDANPEAINDLGRKSKDINLTERFILVNDNFSCLKEIVKKNGFPAADGVLFDLGLSSDLLESSGRGFSFMAHEKLDMRYNPHQSLTADKIINTYDKDDLEKFFREDGGERFAGRIAQAVVRERKNEEIILTSQLVRVIRKALGRHFHIKSLARIFQALRIRVNHEMENLQLGLNSALDVLKPGGRIVVLSYHSGEDRMVKNFFKQESRIKIINKKTIKPFQEEIKNNSRARSAKMRVGEKI